MPVEYITGKVEFREQVFALNQQVLIPRVESEKLVELALSELAKFPPQDKVVVADVGCGCGAIGLSLWLTADRSNLKLYLSDVSPAAVEISKQNQQRLIKPPANITTLHSDLLADYPTNLKLDLIVANLPYIPSDRIKVLDSSVKDYEPHLALDGGPDGLRHIKPLVSQAKLRLNPGGVLLLEIDYAHTRELLIQELDLDQLQFITYRDQFHKTRFALIRQTWSVHDFQAESGYNTPYEWLPTINYCFKKIRPSLD